MEDMFVWMLVFAGAAIGLLGIFLVASERELKTKRREVKELEARLVGNAAEKGADSSDSGEDQRAETAAGAEPSTAQRDLLKQNSELASKLDASEQKLVELQAALQHVDDVRSENRRLLAENHQLRAEIEKFESRQTAEANASAAAARQRESELEAEVISLKKMLEAQQARARELESAQERVADAESRELAFRQEQKTLEARIDDLNAELSAAKETIDEFKVAGGRLAELERLHQEAENENRRLKEEISRWQERIGKSEENQKRLAILRQRLQELQTKQATLTEGNRRFHEDLVAVADLISAAAECAPTADFIGAFQVTPAKTVVEPQDGVMEPPTRDGGH